MVLNGREAGTLDAAAARLRGEGLDVTAAAFDVTDRDAARESVTAQGQTSAWAALSGNGRRNGCSRRRVLLLPLI